MTVRAFGPVRRLFGATSQALSVRKGLSPPPPSPLPITWTIKPAGILELASLVQNYENVLFLQSHFLWAN